MKKQMLPVVLKQQANVGMEPLPERLVLFEKELASVSGGLPPVDCGDGWTCSRADGGSDWVKDD